MTSSKKSETIEVRLPFAAKTAFAERCRADGVTMSDAIRRFVEGHGRARHGIAGPLAVIALLALAVVMSPVAARPDYGAGFDELDRNGDGVVTQAEVPGGGTRCPVALALPLKRGWLGNGPRSFATCREVPAFAILDRDGDGLVTRKEFAAHAIASFAARVRCVGRGRRRFARCRGICRAAADDVHRNAARPGDFPRSRQQRRPPDQLRRIYRLRAADARCPQSQ